MCGLAAWTGGKERTREEVLAEVRRLRADFPAAWVCLTGGEPLLQDISGLVRDLKKEGLKVQAETNGTVDRILPIDWYTVSPKPPEYVVQPRFLKTAKEAKLVVSRELSFDFVRRVRKEFPPLTPVFLQPESNHRRSTAKAIEILQQGLKEGLENIRISVQLHKVLGIK